MAVQPDAALEPPAGLAVAAPLISLPVSGGGQMAFRRIGWLDVPFPAGAKSADLGGDPARGTLVLDFNFAYQPSCAFDPRWACPLAPPRNWLDIPIRAGERLS